MSNQLIPGFRPVCGLALVGWLLSGPVLAEDAGGQAGAGASGGTMSVQLDIRSPMEEVVVLGRQRSAATDVISERIEESVAIDFLGAEAIARVGDGDAATALKRVPGLTLVGGKFIYVRGLGERYSSAQLNGAQVPSPDLTRNVLPLDIFPTSIIDALAVHKGYQPALPAAFGGGNVDIRTKRVPEDRVLSITVGSGFNTESDDDGWTYAGGDDDFWGTDDGTRALPRTIADAIQIYEGSFNANNILGILERDGEFHTFEEAAGISRQLATSLNRNIDLRPTSLDPDLGVEATGGYRWFLTDELEFGFLALGSYDSDWRNRERVTRQIARPDTDFSETLRTTYQVSLTGSLNVGARYGSEHEIGNNTLFLRNTEDDASVSLTCSTGQFNDCGDGSSPARGRLTATRYEERELLVNQWTGAHTLGPETLEMFPPLLDGLRDGLSRLEGLKLEWYYSEATAETGLPGEVSVSAVELLDPADGSVVDTLVRATTTAGSFRYSNLEDEVDSYGWELMLPIYGDGWDLELSGGYDYTRKARQYQQINLGLGSTNPSFSTVASGTPSEVFSDANLTNPALDFGLLVGVAQFGRESYFSGQTTDASWGHFDLLLNETWRISGGVRYELFNQISVPYDPLEFESSRIPISAQQIADAVISTDDIYPSLGLTYIRPGFLADEFQLRLGWSETAARPDLREASESTYIDPLTEARVRGNPNLRPSELTNYDVRAEWFWATGDQLTVSFFFKDIQDPIETVQGGATEDNILFNFLNAESAETYGIELEGLKSMEFLHDWLGGWAEFTETLYIQGNATFSDSDLNIGNVAGSGQLTNQNRRMTQHSEYVLNLQVGWDSLDNRHGLTLAFNTFGERIFYAGVLGFEDAFQQPLDSLDFTYSWYPTEQITVKFKARNLLDDNIEIEQEGSDGEKYVVLEQQIGTTLALDFKWEL